MPLFTPAKLHEVARVVHETPPGEMVTVYSTVPAALTAGQEIVSVLLDDVVAFAVVGVTGSGGSVVVVAGATVVVGATVVAVPETPATRDFVPAVPAPTPFTALTDTTYVVPSVRPVSVHVKAFVVQPAVDGVVVTW